MIPSPRWVELSSRATHLHRKGLTPQGLEPMTQAIALAKAEPGLADEVSNMLNYLANMLLAVGRLVEAETTIREAMRHESDRGRPDSDSNLMTLARILHQQGRCDEAVRIGKRALVVRRKEHGWLSDYYRQSKKVVASFKKPPVQRPAEAEKVGRGAA